MSYFPIRHREPLLKEGAPRSSYNFLLGCYALLFAGLAMTVFFLISTAMKSIA